VKYPGLKKQRGSSITYCIAIGPQQGRMAFSQQTLPLQGCLEENSAPGWRKRQVFAACRAGRRGA